MSSTTTVMGDARGPVDERWAADMLYGSEPSAAPAAENASGAGDAEFTETGSDDDEQPERVDLDGPEAPSPQPDEHVDVNAGAKKTALVFGAGLAVAVVGIVSALVTFNDNPPAPPSRAEPVAAVAAVPVPTTPAAPPDQDQAIPFTASANCPAGSTSAQALNDATTDSAWVCVRGAQGAAVDGQVLHVDLGRAYLLTAVSVTPGWVAKTPGGKDEWLQHRVVTRLQYAFNDDDRTIFTQDTGNAHGPVTTPLPKKVLASRATVIVLQTSRPPASPLPTTDPITGGQPGYADSLLGANGGLATATTQPDLAGTPSSDPVDATFAISALKIFGHQPD
jgi:hypothetical protein